jgi:hypothetical protein
MFFGIKVKLPVDVRVDNIGAIYLSNEAQSSTRTRHMDIRTKFIVEMQQDKLIHVTFTKSADNKSDCATKNVTAELLDIHINQLIADRNCISRSSIREGVEDANNETNKEKRNECKTHSNSMAGAS